VLHSICYYQHLLLQLEWSPAPGFEAATTTTQLVTHVATGTSTYTITALTTGTNYYIRLSSVNGLGKGPATAVQMATPLASSDAPVLALLQQLDPLLHSAADVSSSLDVTWLPPQHGGASVGSGGAAVLGYLIETTAVSFSTYISAVQTVTDTCSTGSLGMLRFNLTLLLLLLQQSGDATVATQSALLAVLLMLS
jgi:hypothetical protein